MNTLMSAFSYAKLTRGTAASQLTELDLKDPQYSDSNPSPSDFLYQHRDILTVKD
jgi:hypothetical protein